MTPQEAAEIVGCSVYTIKELARGHRIPFYKVGVRYMFTRSALVDWIKQQENSNYKNR